jgi:hypothetical protein
VGYFLLSDDGADDPVTQVRWVSGITNHGWLKIAPVIFEDFMKFVDYKHGRQNGIEVVKWDYEAEGSEFDKTVADYKRDLSFNIKEYMQGATRKEKASYRAGYLARCGRGIEQIAGRSISARTRAINRVIAKA